MEPRTITVTLPPGALTPARVVEIAEAFRALLNAIGRDLDPSAGDLVKFQRMEWIDDGDDTLTVRVGGA